VDTAGVQLLLSFRMEAAKRGVHVEIRGESAAFTQALAVLGLRDAFPATVP
jgi:anti-anti-sigma regulatory factor